METTIIFAVGLKVTTYFHIDFFGKITNYTEMEISASKSIAAPPFLSISQWWQLGGHLGRERAGE